MPSTLSVPLELTVDVHKIEGGGVWGEVREFPGCIAQAETLETLRTQIVQAIRDWWAALGIQTEETAKQLASIQGTRAMPEGPYPLSYDDPLPPSWTEADEDE